MGRQEVTSSPGGGRTVQAFFSAIGGLLPVAAAPLRWQEAADGGWIGPTDRCRPIEVFRRDRWIPPESRPGGRGTGGRAPGRAVLPVSGRSAHLRPAPATRTGEPGRAHD